MTITISHSHAEGTLLTGTERGDGSADAIKTVVNIHTERPLWRWSRKLGAWYVPNSRDKNADEGIVEVTKICLEIHEFTVELDIDNQRRSAEEIEAARIAREQDRATGLAARAGSRRAAADHASAREAAASAAVPPGGEPVKVGHHSEARHLKALDRARTALSASVQADREADQAEARAAAAQDATARRYDPNLIRRRLDKLTSDLRKAERARDGHARTLYIDPDGTRHQEITEPATGAHRQRVLDEIDSLNEQITMWNGHLNQAVADGAQLWGKSTIHVGDIVRTGRIGYRVMKVNAKSVRVADEFGGGLLPYSKITKVNTTDGKPVSIVDGARVVG